LAEEYFSLRDFAEVFVEKRDRDSLSQQTKQPVEKCPAEFMRKDELNNPPSHLGRAKTKGESEI
ncbi:MAG TPA: hypothetical protein VF026_13620, partial [Ktedonobacteraceae bacterium]